MLQEKGIKVSDHLNLRLREISSAPSRRIGKVFPDDLTVKKAMVYVYSKRMLVQVIDGPETVVNQEKDICFFVQVLLSSFYFCLPFILILWLLIVCVAFQSQQIRAFQETGLCHQRRRFIGRIT